MFTIATAPKPALQSLQQDGLCLLQTDELNATLASYRAQGLGSEHPPTPAWHGDWSALTGAWDRLPPDLHLKDGGHYRQRRHSCYVQTLATGQLELTPHRAHWQPTEYNALHGGFERWFEPVEPEVASAAAWTDLISQLGQLFAQVRPTPHWHIEAHQFRIDTAGGVGRPTPEGAHRDGVDFVAVVLLRRHGVKGGETRVFDAHGPHGLRFVMAQPLSALLLDDTRVIHETTPILPTDPAKLGFRDTLVLTYRAAAFQAPP
jgi:hypothetical protein